tara:strand:- start:482 stop:622 length:141 start_codon:yes stop_codon:yes gene_type:complete
MGHFLQAGSCDVQGIGDYSFDFNFPTKNNATAAPTPPPMEVIAIEE